MLLSHETRVPLPLSALTRTAAGRGLLTLRRSGKKTVVAQAFATSPLRLLMPRNHGDAAWVFFASLGGGLVDGDQLDVRVDAGEGAAALIGTQASTKVYRSPRGCSQRIEVQAAEGAAVAILPDPVVCFAGARYSQEINVSLAASASLLLLDGYTCGRGARGERWQFARFASRTTIVRDGKTAMVDATRLDEAQGSIAQRMGRFGVVLSLVAIGERFATLREPMLALRARASRADATVVAVSQFGVDAAIVRIAAERFESASRVLHPSFSALSRVLGDDPFARKW
jgi:urease accessory protein